MKHSINVYEFRDAFRDHDRMAGWSYDGLGVLFECLESFDDDCGTETELDVVALCCEFNEATPEEIANDYNIPVLSEKDDWDADDYEEYVSETVLEYLNDNTMVCGVTKSGSIVYQQF